jgi:hypothetical protein
VSDSQKRFKASPRIETQEQAKRRACEETDQKSHSRGSCSDTNIHCSPERSATKCQFNEKQIVMESLRWPNLSFPIS